MKNHEKSKIGIDYFLIVFPLWIVIALSLFGCSTPEIVYRDKIIVDTFIKAVPSVYRDTLKLQGDTVVKWAYRIRGKDTVLRIRYYPKTDTLHIEHKPDTVRIPFRYTKQEYKPIIQQDSKSFTDYFYLLIIPFLYGLYLWLKRNK